MNPAVQDREQQRRPTKIAVFGSSGFIGGRVSAALKHRGIDVLRMQAPRIHTADHGWLSSPEADHVAEGLLPTLDGCSAIINAAGVPDATASRADDLIGANALLPGLLAVVAKQLGIRFVHVSSSAVQGRMPQLDSTSTTAPFSAYSDSKTLGEEVVRSVGGAAVIYRPPGVHAPERDTTRKLIRVARSPIVAIAAPGTSNSPQALADNVADAIAFLATYPQQPPRLVHHPSEGLTTSSLLYYLSGRHPRHVPRLGVRIIVRAVRLASHLRPALAGQARRIEILTLGQDQAPSWLSETGWAPVVDIREWSKLAMHEVEQQGDS